MPKTKKSEKFPQTLYVTQELPENDDPWFQTHADLETAAVISETIEVAEYQLVAVRKVSTEIKAE